MDKSGAEHTEEVMEPARDETTTTVGHDRSLKGDASLFPCACGAERGETDEEGFCLGCGQRVRRPVRDHLEIRISTGLAGVSDRGQRHRCNQDALALAEADATSVLVVCDGVSSTAGAERASELVANAILASLTAPGEPPVSDGTKARLSEAIARAGVALRRAEAEASTTVVAAVACPAEVIIGWMGDSRAYWLPDDGPLQRLTRDHSWLEERLEAEVADEAALRSAPQAHAITRWLGAEAEAEPEVHRMEMAAEGDGWLLLCTDGLWNEAENPASLEALLREAIGIEGEALTAARALVGFANSRGGRDNITAALCRVVAAGKAE